MEKLAVDLEKLLDDFEFHEEQRIDIASKQAPHNNTFNCNNDYSNYPRHFIPASNYRRPPFEPINLSDANYTIDNSSPPASPPVQLLKSQPTLNQHQPSYSYGNSCNSNSNILNYESVSRDDGFTRAANDKLRLCSFSKEFKPDLIKSNSDICTSLSEFDRFERHLPDIASTDVEIKDEKANFDLITNSVDKHLSSDNDGVVEKVSEIITFPTAADISENELHKYLEELEKNENENIEQATNHLVETNYSKEILIPSSSEFGKNDYKRGNEIQVDESYNVKSDENLENTISSVKKTSLNLDTCTGDVTTVEITENSVPEKNERKKLMQETTSISGGMGEISTESVIDDKMIVAECEIPHSNSVYIQMSDNKDTCAINEKGKLVNSKDTTDDTKQNCEILYSSKHIVESENESKDLQTTIDEFSNTKIAVRDVEAGEVILAKQHLDEVIDPNSEDTIKDSFILSSDAKSVTDDSEITETTFENNREEMVVASTSKSEKENSSNEDVCDMYKDVQSKVPRPDSLNLTHTTPNPEMSSTSADSGSLLSVEERKLGKEPPVWIPDSETNVCMHCQMKFTLVRRRHHCRACGFVLCSKCCDLKANLEYLKFEEARVCHSCHSIIEKVNNLEAEISSLKRPNPNNPMEYCSTIPPLLQVGPTQPAPPSVLVPVVGVLKREGRNKSNDTPKQVIFSDGIRPGGDLTELDAPSEPRLPLRRHSRVLRRVGTPPGNAIQHRRMLNPKTQSFIPSNQDLPPLVVKKQGDIAYTELEKPLTIEDEAVKFAINRNLFVLVKRIMLDCCVNREVWCITTEGLSCVGQDEVIFILELLPDEKYPPKDVFCVVNMLYQEASKGSTVSEMTFVASHMNQLFGSKDHAGFVFIRPTPTYQCVEKLILPKPPFLIALLIHKWEAPWARLFPIRLVLRLGAEFRYYPCPLVSVRNRPALFTDIGNTIIGLLADFRKYSYTLPTIRGLMIHMEDRLTTILLPRNRYDQVIRAMNNSEENVLAFAGNISTVADSHLVCIQSSTQDDISYHTQAINILNKPRQVTGASFIVFNGSLKQCSWAGKSNIVEDGLMVQIPSESMTNLRNALRQMNDYSIGCGPQAEERVVLKWAPDDVNFNIAVKSNIDNKPLDGVPSIRVHNGTDYSSASRLLRWTEVFILQSGEDSGSKTGDTVNISKLSESIARATCIALVPLLDLLATSNLRTLAVRVTIHPENVGYEAGSGGEKLRPLYMNRLDNELIAVVHEAAVSIRDITCPIVLELIFKIMEQG